MLETLRRFFITLRIAACWQAATKAAEEKFATTDNEAPYCDNRMCGHWDRGVCAIGIADCLARI